jgi:hypothetical protein
MSDKELELAKQKLTELEEKISDLDLDQISSKKGSKLKDRLVESELDSMKKRITDIEEILGDMDPDDVIKHKKGSKLKDR